MFYVKLYHYDQSDVQTDIKCVQIFGRIYTLSEGNLIFSHDCI